MSSIDTNVNNYTIDELLAILELEDPTDQEITDSTNDYIDKYETEGDDKMSQFFKDMQTKLLQYMNSLENGDDPGDYSPDDQQTNSWWENQAQPQDDETQNDKVTDRKQKVDVYDDQHVPMTKDQLGVNNTYDTGVAQDVLNPNLTNVTTRMIVLDSQFRQSDVNSTSGSTDYTLDLSETLNNVISLRLYSIQIPVTWYLIDTTYGNTCLWVTTYDLTGKKYEFVIEIRPGDYTANELCNALNKAFAAIPLQNNPYTGLPYTQGFVSYDPSIEPVTYDANNGKITIMLNAFEDPATNTITGLATGATPTDTTPFITFYDSTRKLQCTTDCTSPWLYFDRSLGWLMGYRSPVVYIFEVGNTGAATANLFGPKYFILIIDDYNQNHINNGVVNIAELSKKLSIPNYYRPDLPYTCVQTDTKNIPSLVPSAPRTLTQAQMYTINEIIKNREQDTNTRGKPPSSSDALAIIPLKVGGMSIGDVYVEFGGTLQDNKRTYFGPVNIERFHVKLLDDQGHVVNLNGADWCVTLISENLYQY